MEPLPSANAEVPSGVRAEVVGEQFLHPLKSLLAHLQEGGGLLRDEVTIPVHNNESRRAQLPKATRHMLERDEAIHDAREPKRLTKALCHRHRLHTEAKELHSPTEFAAPPRLHLSSAGAAPASSAIVKMNDGQLAILKHLVRAGQRAVHIQRREGADRMEGESPTGLQSQFHPAGG